MRRNREHVSWAAFGRVAAAAWVAWVAASGCGEPLARLGQPSKVNQCKTDADCPAGYPCVFPAHRVSTLALGSSEVPDAEGPGALGVTSRDAGFGDAGLDASFAAETDARAPRRPDAGPAPIYGRCAPQCDDLVCKARLGDRAECDARTFQCHAVDCGRTVTCLETTEPLYCDLSAHTCHRTNGVCGVVDNEDYGCPDLNYLLPPNVSVSCDASEASTPGICRLNRPRPVTPIAAGAATLTIDSPQDGTVFADENAVAFRYRVSQAHFLLVTTQIPETEADKTADAIWGVALPSSSDAAREIRWADGYAISGSVWKNDPGTVPVGQDLFAMVVGVDGSEKPIAETGALVRFRVGVGWSIRGSACSSDGGASACENPLLILSCIADACEQLCLRDLDCTAGAFCDFTSELPHCVNG